MRQPLLLTGEPGVGKTRLAYALAHELSLGPPLECFVKSITTKEDLFHSVDNIRRFYDAQSGAGRTLRATRDYLTFHGLGKAILLAGGPDHRLQPLPGRKPDDLEPTLARFFDLVPDPEFWNGSPALRVVLIDELDKAPRDTPNDMLNEIERMRFEIAELGVAVESPDEMRPIVVITSNSEKSLPEPFLRRCVYFDVRFPAGDELRNIVERRLRSVLAETFQAQHDGSNIEKYEKLLSDCLQFIELLRAPATLTRPPSLAEILSWISLLAQYVNASDYTSLHERLDIFNDCLPVLIKTADDIYATRQAFRDWSETKV